jgi:hypothetical protein
MSSYFRHKCTVAKLINSTGMILCWDVNKLFSSCFVNYSYTSYSNMKSINFWDKTPCSPLGVNRHSGFPAGRLFCLPPACLLVYCWTYFFDPKDGGDIFLSKRLLALSGLHGAISQKLILFITTAVKTSNPTYRNMFHISVVFIYLSSLSTIQII